MVEGACTRTSRLTGADVGESDNAIPLPNVSANVLKKVRVRLCLGYLS